MRSSTPWASGGGSILWVDFLQRELGWGEATGKVLLMNMLKSLSISGGNLPWMCYCFPAFPNQEAKHDFIFMWWLRAIIKHEWLNRVLIRGCPQGLWKYVRLFAPVLQEPGFSFSYFFFVRWQCQLSLILGALVSLPTTANLLGSCMFTLYRKWVHITYQ